MNTQISYQDRHATTHAVVLRGSLQPAQVRQVRQCLSQGEFFVPAQVRLPSERQEWHELLDVEMTEQPPSCPVAAQELVDGMQLARGRWQL